MRYQVLLALSLLTCGATLPAVAAPLAERLFPETKLAQCRTLSRGPALNLAEWDPSLETTATAVLSELRRDGGETLQKLFHPLLKPKLVQGQRLAGTLGRIYRKPWDFSVYRVWALYSPGGDPAVQSCEEGGAVEVNTRFGHPLQIGLWLQLMGENELGRIFVLLVPYKEEWRIGAVHITQWSHQGKDAERWAADGAAAQQRGEDLSAYLSFDIAQKLLDGGALMFLRERPSYRLARDHVLTQAALLALLNKTLATDSMVYAASIFAEDGAGLLLRERLPKALATPELRTRCLNHGKALIAKGLLTPALGGLSCSYLTPGEAIEREGELGSLRFSRVEILAAKP